jgi:hypothetical protein
VLADKQADDARVLMLRADALVHVLLTDDLGQQVGVDATGAVINDLGASAQVLQGPGGWPELILVRDPELGLSQVQVNSTGAGDWSVTAYLSHENTGNLRETSAGNAQGAEGASRVLWLSAPMGLSWHDNATSVPPSDLSQVRFVAGPVPARGELRLSFLAPERGAKVELAIYDLRGRRVALPLPSSERSGALSLNWDGRDRSGLRLARGTYFARLTIDGQEHVRKLVLVD